MVSPFIEISPFAKISPLADLEASIRGTKIIIGEHSFIDSFVKIKPAGGGGDIIIGRNSYINSGCVLYSGNGIIIGDYVSIAANCTLAPVNHEYVSKNLLIQHQGFRRGKGGIVIEDDVWIGANSVLLDGAHLRKGCVIGAMSVVRGEVAPYSINAGNPLRLIGDRR
ncbi:MAG: acyltransferase [Desulfovibrio sp.]|jgi:acetyltransferase-like isoleucine patch superfamily enzyme|nr:acyltransferase [Desulfovibrio sp.]